MNINDKIVLDTNVLLMSISDKGVYRDIWNAFLDKKYTLCISNDIIEEYVEVISRNVNQRVAAGVIYIILSKPNILKVDPHFHFNLIKSDPDDNKFVDCAISSSAHLIVTEDHHFNILKEIPFPKVDVVNINLFLSYIKNL